MTPNEIIAMAREADPFGEDGRLFAMASVAPGTLERFAALVAAKEREACAQVCSDKALRCEAEAQRAIDNGEHDEVSAIRSAARQISTCAAAIRKRGAA